MDDNYQTPLIEQTIRMAARKLPYQAKRNISLRSWQQLHFDSICEHASVSQHTPAGWTYRYLLRQRDGGIVFGTLKNERVHRVAYPTLYELRYNSRRIHSGLEYKTPNEVYNGYLNRQQTA
jgi:hypothetical protein